MPDGIWNKLWRSNHETRSHRFNKTPFAPYIQTELEINPIRWHGQASARTFTLITFIYLFIFTKERINGTLCT